MNNKETPGNGNFKVLIILTLIIVTGAVLRIFDLSSKSLWTDELFSIWHAQSIINVKTFLSPLVKSGIFFSSAVENAHPPLYFLLLKFWSFIGKGEFFYRLLTVIFGILVIPATYSLGKQFFSKKASLIGAFLVAISPLHILYDREVRMYTLLTLLTVVSYYFFVRALREGKTKFWIGYTFFTVLNTYTHYHAFLVILSQWVFFLVRLKQHRHFIRQALTSQLIVAVIFFFWLPAFLYHLGKYGDPEGFLVISGSSVNFPFSILSVLFKPLYLLSTFSIGQTVLPWRWIITIPAFIIFLILFTSGIKNMFGNRETLQFFLIALFIPILAGLFISQMLPRYFLFLAPIYSLIIANGIANSPTSKLRVISVAIIIILLSYPLKNYYLNKEFHMQANTDSWREVGYYLKENVKQQDIVFNICGVPINYYTGFDIPVLIGKNAFQVIRKELREKEGQFNRIWVIAADAESLSPEGEKDAIRWLNKHYILISEKKYLHDPDYFKKRALFNKEFREYRIKIYLYANENGQG